MNNKVDAALNSQMVKFLIEAEVEHQLIVDNLKFAKDEVVELIEKFNLSSDDIITIFGASLYSVKNNKTLTLAAAGELRDSVWNDISNYRNQQKKVSAKIKRWFDSLWAK